MATSQGSISVSPGIPVYAAARAKQLGLERNIYLAILLHNYLNNPRQLLPVVETPKRVVKARIQLTIPRVLRVQSIKSAARWKLSLSTLVEALVMTDAEDESETLFVLPIYASQKPELKYST